LISILFAKRFGNQLEGRSCIISRLHCPEEIERPENYFTLHQIVYKVLKKSSSSFELSGELMLEYVQGAIEEVFNEMPSEETVLKYYLLIRDHKNNSADLVTTSRGLEVLNAYHRKIAEGMDWEDSLRSATWLLKKDSINSLYQFQFDNIILAQPEILKSNNNKNALEFFLALSNWMENYTRHKVFIVSEKGVVWKLNKGKFEINCHLRYRSLDGLV
jgi:hypothetical protein